VKEGGHHRVFPDSKSVSDPNPKDQQVPKDPQISTAQAAPAPMRFFT